MQRSEVLIDLDAITANTARLVAGTSSQVMAVVKADGYGHGLLPSARAALAGGASWLGVAMLDEALDLRAAGLTSRVLAWLWSPQDAGLLRRALAEDVDVSVSTYTQLDLVAAAAAELGVRARVHLKIDTGLSRNGANETDWPGLVAAAVAVRRAGLIESTGVWSHFVYADSPGHPTTADQTHRFVAAVEVAAELGFTPEVRHLANSAATVTLPDTHFDLVRPGVAIYGLSPVPELGDFGLLPAMTLTSHLANVKQLPAGQGVSYGHAYTTSSPTTVGLVPLGYADGIPRAASNLGPVQLGGERYRISGRVCMDQFVLDVGNSPVHEGDPVVLFGSGAHGEPTAQDWADALGTIHYEIVTRIGPRVPRRYVGSDGAAKQGGN